MMSVRSATDSISVTYRQILTTTSFLTLYNSTMDVGDHGVSTRDIMLKPGNDSMRVHDAMVDFGDGYMCIYRKLGLGMPI